jgi:hypothetical protein
MMRIILVLLPMLFFIGSALNARPADYSDYKPSREHVARSSATGNPFESVAVHNVGDISLTVSNYGIIGHGDYSPPTDPMTGDLAPALYYPSNNEVNYLFEAALWIGGIINRDTLVSTAGGGRYYQPREFWSDSFPTGEIVFRSINDPDAPEFDSAISQQDFIAYFTDTLDDPIYTGYDHYTGRNHIPLGIKAIQRSYSWGYEYTDDFVIIDYTFTNITFKDIDKVYIGLFVDNDIGRRLPPSSFNPNDDVVGFRRTAPSHYLAGLVDTLNVAWAADNDGDPNPYTGAYLGLRSPTAAAGVAILRAPSDIIDPSFNWWAVNYNPYYNWGPRRQKYAGEPIRTFGGELGTPLTDADKYYMMARGGVDYDLWSLDYFQGTDGWLSAPDPDWHLSSGTDIRYLLSIGPYDMEPGRALKFTIAFVMGQYFWRDMSKPGPSMNFEELDLNTLWAKWIFDNPGVDTDGDGYKGKYYVSCFGPRMDHIDTIVTEGGVIYDTVYICTREDTLYYKGDGVPDFRAAFPPQTPEFSLHPWIDEFNQGVIDIHWNGLRSETVEDQFSRLVDFEGYRIYSSITGHPGDFTMHASFDKQNYNRWEYNEADKEWKIIYHPFSLEQLRGWYGVNFDPDFYYDTDHLFPVYNYGTGEHDFYYFTRNDWNHSNLTDTLGIYKVYPSEIYPPTLNIDSARIYYPDILTEDGKFKYFEYRYRLTRLLPSQQYYVAVSAFDHGNPSTKLGPMEIEPSSIAIREYPQNESGLAVSKGLDVIVYPNPYRIDANYRDRYEGWDDDEQGLPAEKTRAIHFTNLPHKCTIRIFSLDGDLIRAIEHNYPEGAAGSMHEKWDLISRNTMMIVSGIYYFVVDSEYGSQIGKIVIIR